MSFASRHAKGSIFECNTDGFEYKKLEELYKEAGADHEHQLQGLYINRKSEYGDAPVAITTDCFVNLPQYMLDECAEILKSENDINDIKAGKVGFKVETYEKELNKKKKLCYGIRWIDIA